MMTPSWPDRSEPVRTTAALLTAVFAVALAACGGDAAQDGAEMDGAEMDGAMDGAAAMADAALVNPNEADAATLAGVPGLDSAAVALILDGRPFETMVPLHAALSARMDSAALDGVYGRMFIPLDLNTALEEEIMLIPGVGPRMAHEFDEYRPYEAIERFRREIGKYVDDEEVARLERYVVIR